MWERERGGGEVRERWGRVARERDRERVDCEKERRREGKTKGAEGAGRAGSIGSVTYVNGHAAIEVCQPLHPRRGVLHPSPISGTQ